VVAGQFFYPRRPEELRRTIAEFLRHVRAEVAAAPKAIIAPHAGYVFFGPIAASAYARFAPDRNNIKRIVLIGPSHHVPFDGLAASSAEAFATPLGLVPVDSDAIRQICSLPQVAVLDEAHARNIHSKFICHFCKACWRILKSSRSSWRGDRMRRSRVISALWGRDRNTLVISSD